MTAQVIVTADDGGFCPAVNEAIIDLYQRGVISRAALFATYGDFEDLRRELPACARIPHVSLSFGRPRTASEGINRLLDSDGLFTRPTISQERSLFVAMATHGTLVMRKAKAYEVQAEVQAQCEVISGNLDGQREYTFHHNLDFYLTPHYYRTDTGIISRRDCVEAGVYAGYDYLFLDRDEGEEIAAARIAELLRRAVDDSRAAGGAPVEVALHPATSGRELAGLTSYSYERYIEFRAWQSKPVEAILSQSERVGSRFVFA